MTFSARKDSVVEGSLPSQATANAAGALAQPKSANGGVTLPNGLVPTTQASTLAPTTFLGSTPPPHQPRQESPSGKDSMVVPPHRRPRPARQSVTAVTAPSTQPTPIVEKLPQPGVSVSQPKPANKEPGDDDAPVYRGRGGNSAINNSSPGAGRGVTAVRKAVRRGAGAWAHRKEISKGDPDRWKTDWAGTYHEQPRGWAGESDKPGSAEWAHTGLGGGAWELADWDGNWAPAPCDWDSRPAFRTDQSEDQIWQWLGCVERALRIRNLEPGMSVREALPERRAGPALDELSTVDGMTYVFGAPAKEVQGIKYQQMGDIIPRQWIPEAWGRLPPQTFWQQEILRSTAPPPEDAGDLDGVRPWWELVVKGGNFLPQIKAPSIAGIDPSETKQERMKRESDLGSAQHAENRKRFELAKMKSQRVNQQRKDEKAKKLAAARVANNGVTPEKLSRVTTGIKLFIRHATSDDMKQIRDLYNYYVDFTCAAHETERVSTGDMARKHREVLERELPYLVAYEKGAVHKARRKHQEDIVLPDKIVGFALANDLYGPCGNMFRYAFEVELYVHRDALMRGVAKCLLDKLLALLDPDYLERGGYGVGDEDLETGVARPSRLVQNLLINFYHESNKPQKLAWVSRFLKQFAGFDQVGHIENVGSKNTAVSHAIFQRVTGAVLDHENAPDVLLSSSPQ